MIQVSNSQNVQIEPCQLNGSGMIGVTSYHTKNLRVVDNYIYNNSEYGVLFDESTTIEILNNRFTQNGPNGNDHVVKALNSSLSEVEKLDADLEKGGIKMSGNVFH